MKAKRYLKWLFFTIPVVALLGIAGWLSTASSRSFCQRTVGSWLLTEGIGSRPFYLLDADADKDVRATFDSLGATYWVHAPDPHDPAAWPRLALKSHTAIPFFVAVDYFWEREADLGGGGTRWFFCYFGRVVEIGDTDRFST
jgi:hypothetical protein